VGPQNGWKVHKHQPWRPHIIYTTDYR
jgi:hypothetical protein